VAKVLLVEDDNNLREIYQARLMAEGYDIVAAQNGEEALVVAKQNKPDLIISDVMMPRISGFEMLDILRNTDELKHTKVIMLTALGQTEDQKRADNLGADRYLIKSQVTLEDIVNAAKELLGEDGAVADVPAPPAPKAEPAVASPAPVATTPSVTPAPVAPAPSVAGPTPTVQPVAVAIEPVAAPAVVPAPVATSTPPTPVADVPVAPEPPAAGAVTPVISMPNAGSTTQPATETTAPIATPAAVPPTPAPAPTPSAAVPDTAQTLEAEEAALQAQIKTYADAPAPTPTAAEPAASSTPATDTASNDAAIANAVQQLNTATTSEPVQPPSVTNTAVPAALTTPAPEPAATPTISSVATPAVPPTQPATETTAPIATPAAVPPTPAPAPTPSANDDSLAVSGRKVIQPINPDASKPNLDELLAKEAAAEPVPPATPIVDGATAATPPPPPMPPHTPGQSFDPNKAL